MRPVFRAAALTLALVASSVSAQTATEIKKDLFPKFKKAQAAGKDLGDAGKEYEAGDKALKDGMQDEALEHFKKAQQLWPKDAQ
jgi:TolA-binding protein